MANPLASLLSGLKNLISTVEADIGSEFKGVEAEAAPIIKKTEQDISAIAEAGWGYIRNNGLTALYQTAAQFLLGAGTGMPWLTVLSNVAAQAEAAGLTIVKGAESIVVGQAQADLIAAGKLISPSLVTGNAAPAQPADAKSGS